jgi:hypothetical protein
MDKRLSKRVKTHQLARVCGKIGVVHNLSSRGLEVSTAFLPKTRKIDISFEALGKDIKITGTVQWLRRKSKVRNLNQLGVFVKEAPIQYYQLIDHLSNNSA